MTDGLGCGGGPDNGYCLVREDAGAVSLHQGEQRRWAGESRHVKGRWGRQRTAGGSLVGGDHVNLAALVAHGPDQRIAAGEGMNDEQAGAGSKVAQNANKALLPLVRGHEIHVGAGLLERPCGFCAHCGDAWAGHSGRKAAVLHA